MKKKKKTDDDIMDDIMLEKQKKVKIRFPDGSIEKVDVKNLIFPAQSQSLDERIEIAINYWIAQGRTEEQIYGVRNFMSGRGLRLIKEEVEARDTYWKKVIDTFTKDNAERIKEEVEKENLAWLNHERCIHCGRKMKPSPTTDTCHQCWEEN